MNLNKINKVHLIGIGGIGVSAVAKYFLHFNKIVSGSDVYQTPIITDLEKRGVKIYLNHKSDNLPNDVDLVVYSAAVPEDNPERIQAQKLNITQMSYPEFLGDLSLDYKTIAVSGTNGKSTTTAILGKIFVEAGIGPTIIVGTQVPGFDGNIRIGQSNILIVEACEWRGHMLNLHPEKIILTNLEPDHLDYYKDLDDIKQHFQKYIDQLPIRKGVLAYNADCLTCSALNKEKGYKVKTWSLRNNQADFFAHDIKTANQKLSFMVNHRHFELNVPGVYNIYNALAAMTIAKHFKITDEVIKKVLTEFSGTWRRFELVGQLPNQPNTLVISDYGHHPDAIRGVLAAAKEFYPDKRLVAVFQPHHYDRTAKLFNEFVKSFSQADVIIIPDIYDVTGRQNDGVRTVTSNQLVEEIIKINPGKEVIYSGNLSSTKQQILQIAKDNDLILLIGAGDIDEIARDLIK